MYEVKLESWDGEYIKAPDFCPYKVYKERGEGESYEWSFVIHPSICNICRLCNFIPSFIDIKNDLRTVKFVEYLTLINKEVATSIFNQNSFLRKKDRIPLAILINPEIFEMMLKLVYADNEEKYKQAYTYYINNEIPLCYILGCPVYLSRKLTKSKIIVIGEVEWK